MQLLNKLKLIKSVSDAAQKFRLEDIETYRALKKRSNMCEDFAILHDVVKTMKFNTT